MLHVPFLCIHAQDENVVDVDETDGTTSKNDKKPVSVKHEVVEAAEPVEAAGSTPELPTAGKGSSTQKDLWSALLHQLVESDKFPSHWMATIEYGNGKYNVCSDLLKPATKNTPEPERAKYSATGEFDPSAIFANITKDALLIAVDQLSCQCLDSMKGVEIEKEVKEERHAQDTAKGELRVVALKDFKTSELVLPPFQCALEQYVARVSKRKTEDIAKSDEEKEHKKNEGGIVEAFGRVAFKKIRLAEGREGPVAHHPPSVKFSIKTPLASMPKFQDHLKAMDPDLDTKDTDQDDCFSRLSPFWAIGQTKKSSEVNMEIYKVSIPNAPVHPTGLKRTPPSKQAQYDVSLQCARNTRTVKKGERLALSAMIQDVSDSDSE